MVTQRPDQQAQADQAVADDHDGGKDRVAGQRGLVRAARQHDRDDQRYLDDRDGEGQHEGAEGLADAVRHDFRMVYCRNHGTDQSGGTGRAQDDPQWQHQGDSENGGSAEGDQGCPKRHPGFR